MNKKDLARRLAKESHRSRAQAADEVDNLIHRLLMDLKKPGHNAKTAPSNSARGVSEKKS